MTKVKNWVPLEANPEVLAAFAEKIGLVSSQVRNSTPCSR